MAVRAREGNGTAGGCARGKQRGPECPDRFEDQRGCRASGKSEEDDAPMPAGRIQEGITELGVHRDETSLFADTAGNHVRIARTLHPLIGDSDRIELGLVEQRGRRAAEVLVELELHAGLAAGMSTYRSRLISEP